MKLIHCADVHLGSKIVSKFPKEISKKIKEEVRTAFMKMVHYAHSSGIKVILLSGDVFDSDAPFQKDKDFFISVVKNNADIDFLYLRGNHDLQGEDIDSLPNLKCFTDEWTTYHYENVNISGIEMTKNNCTSLYSTLQLDKERKNIVMLHGSVGSTAGKDTINLSQLKNKNIDYLALGHIHAFSAQKLDDNGIYVYPGCLQGRGFDETGDKGFIEVDIGNKISYRFVPIAELKIIEEDVDVSGKKEAYTAFLKVKEEISFEKNHIYRINLLGDVDYEVESLASDVQNYLSSERLCLFVDVKDKTKKNLDITAFEGDLSLKGEFVRSVWNNDKHTEEEKLAIISYGLKALSGRSVE